MTDKEMILEILKKANITILDNQPCYIDIEDSQKKDEYISFDFDETGKLLSIWG